MQCLQRWKKVRAAVASAQPYRRDRKITERRSGRWTSTQAGKEAVTYMQAERLQTGWQAGRQTDSDVER